MAARASGYSDFVKNTDKDEMSETIVPRTPTHHTSSFMKMKTKKKAKSNTDAIKRRLSKISY